MTVAEAVRELLLTLTPVTDLVNQRLWTFRLPQSPTLPAVLIQQISDVQDVHLRGTSGLRWGRVQIDVLATTILSARAIDQAIQGDYVNGSPTGLRGATATVGGSPSLTIVQAIPDGYRELFDADELRQARVSRDYRVWVQ